VNWDAPIRQYLPEFDSKDKAGVLVRHLITHSAGFPAWKPFYALADSPADVLSVIARTPLGYAPGSRVIYSDLGFITLGMLLEQRTGQSLAKLFCQEVARPIGLTEMQFNPPATLQDKIAPTECGNEYERELARKIDLSEAERCRVDQYSGWRTKLIQGQVHDGNAWFLNGVAGHAGLFGSIEETARLAAQFLPGSDLLQPSTLELFSQNWTPGLGEHRSPGWMLASTPGSSAGEALPPTAFGHTGFTGTSLWVDHEKARIFLLFTNRTYPIVNLHPTRWAFHALAQAALKHQ
jgi:CubicO group peptidase (beta-lactamase class C family)